MNAINEIYRNQLLELERHFQDEINRLESEPFHEFEVTDRGEHASDNYSEDLAIGLAENADIQLVDVKAALKRIDDGTYGICEDCGCEIPSDRLQANPSASHCIECARKTQTVPAASLGNLL